ncbi:lipase family protein [Acidocella sp.]|uniref:lipase family protein n=1 Tax=Acidocella sp. TaxID=50710 RepID=UPI00262FD754|nr:alpha/beta fold hydrolase [Acidocella sp.]MDD2794350.1 alpha/beta fold hydrolase [Acidocella sp.]
MISTVALCAAAAEAYSAPATFVVAGDVHVHLEMTGGITLVTFRGTEWDCIEDWLRDFDIETVNNPHIGPCYRGFLTGALAAVTRLAGVLRADAPFVLTGHSLGGALAVAAAGLLVHHGLIAARCETFGAPRVCVDNTLGKVLAGVPGNRWRNGDDPVPLLPPGGKQDRPLRQIGRPALDPISDHLIAAYAESLAAPVPVPIS